MKTTLDRILAKHTSFKTFAELLATDLSYVPTLNVREAPDLAKIANALVEAGRDAYVVGTHGRGPYFARAHHVACGFSVPPALGPADLVVRLVPVQPPEPAENLAPLPKTDLERLRETISREGASMNKKNEKLIANAVSAEQTQDHVPAGNAWFITGPRGGKTRICVRRLSPGRARKIGKTWRIE